MSIWYQQCKDLSLAQCMALLVWQHWPRQERFVCNSVMGAMGTPGVCYLDQTLLITCYLSGIPAAQVEARKAVFVHWMDVPLIDCPNQTGPGYNLNSSQTLNTMYGLRNLGLLTVNAPMGALLNFKDAAVLLPDGSSAT